METPIGWSVTEKGLTREYAFKDFMGAIQFINAVAQKAEQLGHHPDIFNSYNKVFLTLFTHEEGKITEKDIALANEINKL